MLVRGCDGTSVADSPDFKETAMQKLANTINTVEMRELLKGTCEELQLRKSHSCCMSPKPADESVTCPSLLVQLGPSLLDLRASTREWFTEPAWNAPSLLEVPRTQQSRPLP